MKKIYLLPVLLLFLFALVGFTSAIEVNAAEGDTVEGETIAPETPEVPEVPVEPEVPEVPEVPVEPTCSIKIEDIAYGDILVDKENGNVGDIVTILARPYPLCKLVFVKVNGVDLVPNEDGNYTFALVEGENIIAAEFELNSEQFKEIAGLLGNVKKGEWDQIFSWDNLLVLINFVFSALFSSGFLITLLKNKKIKSNTIGEVKEEVTKILDTKTSQVILDFLRETLSPIMNKIDGKLVDVEDTVRMLASCMILAQQNDDKSRSDIIKLLTDYQKKDADFAAQVEAVLTKQKEKNEEIQKQKVDAIEELKKQNESLESKVEVSEEDVAGRY